MGFGIWDATTNVGAHSFPFDALSKLFTFTFYIYFSSFGFIVPLLKWTYITLNTLQYGTVACSALQGEENRSFVYWDRGVAG